MLAQVNVPLMTIMEVAGYRSRCAYGPEPS
jgi:hypothetical protein